MEKAYNGQTSSSPLACGIIILALIQEQLGTRVQKKREREMLRVKNRWPDILM
jgi:hypothetical protein